MPEKPILKRSLSLSQVVLYGIGTTVGAGIYALIGEISAVAGYLAPWSFLIAAGLAAFTAYSFAHLSAQFPRAAGAALYVEQGLGSTRLAQMVGMLVIFAGIVSSAALLNGFVGYLNEFVDLQRLTIILLASSVLCLLAAWGIAESVWVAGIIAVVEVCGLLWVTGLSAQSIEWAALDAQQFIPTASASTWSLIFAGAALSFYAYIGFEDMVEVAEEVKDVRTNLPRAIAWTLVLTTVIYLLLVTSAILAVGPEHLAKSKAPLAELYLQVTGNKPTIITVIGLFAIINGALIQIIMASRVIYGLASRHQLPHMLAYVHPLTKTPLIATLLVGAAVALLASLGSLASLAEMTSITMLCIFTLVNAALCRLFWHKARLKACIGALGALICAGFALQTAINS